MAGAILSEEKRDENGRFIVPPVSPGRPKGARNKLGTEFLEKMLADFQKHGESVIEKVRDEKPDQYLKVVASILPKEIELGEDTIDSIASVIMQRRKRAGLIEMVLVDDASAS